MSIDIRLLLSLSPEAREQFHIPDNLPQLDANQNHQVDLDEATYLQYQAGLLNGIRNPSTSEPDRENYRSQLSDPASTFARIRSEIQRNTPGILAYQRAAQAWMTRIENITSHSSSLSLQHYLGLPQSFRDHIAPNYFTHLTKVALADSNHDQQSSLQEVAQQITQEIHDRETEAEPQLRQQFNLVKGNNDFIEAAEFTPLFAQLGGEAENATQVFQRVDSDHDGKLNFEEFKRLLIPASSPEEINLRAQARIIDANLELEQSVARINLNLNDYRAVDQFSSRISVFDLAYIGENQLDPGVIRENPTFRLLRFMKGQVGNVTLLNHQRVDELLQTHVQDFQGLILQIQSLVETIDHLPEEQKRPFQNSLRPLQQFLTRFERFAPHYIITETEVKTHLRDLALDPVISALDAINAQSQNRLNGPIEQITRALNPLVQLSGENHIINDANITARLRALQAANPESAPSEHFFRPLWMQFNITQNTNPQHSVYSLTEAPITRVEGNQFLARALVQVAYLHPTQIRDISRHTERLELFYLIEHMIEQGQYDHERAHTDDLIPGVLSPLTTLGRIFHNFRHRNESEGAAAAPTHHTPQALGYFQRAVANRAEQAHRTRLAALEALKHQVEASNAPSLTDAIPQIQNAEQREILTNMLHVPEFERIYYIHNSREQEEAYISFANHTLRGTVDPRNGLWEAFRRRFIPDQISPLAYLQNRNSEAAISTLSRLQASSENAQIRQIARDASTSIRGTGWDLNPLNWSRVASDADGSLDGVVDSVLGNVMVWGLMGLIGKGLGAFFRTGSITNQVLTSFEFSTAWRNHPNFAARGSYWLARGVTIPLRLPMHRQLSSAEIEIVSQRALDLGGSTRFEFGWEFLNGVRSFLRMDPLPFREAAAQEMGIFRQFNGWLNQQRATSQATRLIFNGNTQAAASNIIQLSQRMSIDADVHFAVANGAAQRARTLASSTRLTEQNLIDLEPELRNVINEGRHGHALRTTAVHRSSSIGIPLENSAHYRSFQTTLEGLEDIGISLERAEAQHIAGLTPERLNRLRRYLDRIKEIQSGMNGLDNYQMQQIARGALQTGAAFALANLASDPYAAQVVGRMVNPALLAAQNPMLHGNAWQLYMLGWQMLQQNAMGTDHRSNISLEQFAQSYGINTNPQEIEGAYRAAIRRRGSRANYYRDAFLSPNREPGQETEEARDHNVHFPQAPTASEH